MFTWRDPLLLFIGAAAAALLLRRAPEAPAAVGAAEARKAQLQQQLAGYLQGATAMAMLYLGPLGPSGVQVGRR